MLCSYTWRPTVYHKPSGLHLHGLEPPFSGHFLNYLFIFAFWLPRMACGILVSWSGIELTAAALEAWSFNHWTPRGVLDSHFPINSLLLLPSGAPHSPQPACTHPSSHLVTSVFFSSSCYRSSLLFIAQSRHPTCLWRLLGLFLLLGFLLSPQKVPRSSVFNFVFSLSHCLPPPLDWEFLRSRTLPYFFSWSLLDII